MQIEYMPLHELKRHPRNPKDHDIGKINTSISRFGFVSPVLIDERSGYLVAGHGRLDTLSEMKQRGNVPPARIEARQDDWYVPVVRGIEFNSDSEIEAYLVADNQLTIAGGWNEPELAALLQDLARDDEKLFNTTGFDRDDLEALLNGLDPNWQAAFEKVPDGDKSSFEQMTFTLHGKQALIVRDALNHVKQLKPEYSGDNENSNGNALHYLCEVYLSEC